MDFSKMNLADLKKYASEQKLEKRSTYTTKAALRSFIEADARKRGINVINPYAATQDASVSPASGVVAGATVAAAPGVVAGLVPGSVPTAAPIQPPVAFVPPAPQDIPTTLIMFVIEGNGMSTFSVPSSFLTEELKKALVDASKATVGREGGDAEAYNTVLSFVNQEDPAKQVATSLDGNVLKPQPGTKFENVYVIEVVSPSSTEPIPSAQEAPAS
jgi:hypothetical protein